MASGVDKRLDLLLARCATEAERANRFVSRLSTNAQRLAMEQRDSSLPERTDLAVQKRATSIARQDPKGVAIIIKGWLAREH